MEDPTGTSPAPTELPPAPAAASAPPPTIVVNAKGPNFLVRLLWFIFIGWWLSGIAILITWLFAVTVIGLPVTYWLANRLPAIQTLRPRRMRYEHQEQADGSYTVKEQHREQFPIWLRILYFPLGLLLGLIWMFAAWLISLPIITLPISIMMLNRVPFVMTLQRN